MAGKKIIIGSKLPTSLILNHPLDRSVKVTLNGVNSTRILDANGNHSAPAAGYATTEVDAEFWEAWLMAHSPKGRPFKALESGAIFEASSEASAKSIAAEFRERKTGLEPLGTDGKDERAPGVKKITKE